MDLKLHPAKIFYGLLAIIAALTILNFIGICITHYANLPKVEEHLVRLVDFDKERNIPAFYSALAMMFAAIILSYITVVQKNIGGDYRRWFGLAVLFVFLSMDEAVSIHELLSGPTRTVMDLDGALYLAWVVPYTALAVALLVVYVKFLLNLKSVVRWLLVLAGAVFVAGAVGFELLGSNYHYIGKAEDPGYALIYTLEELLEMLGIAIFLYTLLLYIQTELYNFTLRISVEKPLVLSREEKLNTRAKKEEMLVA